MGNQKTKTVSEFSQHGIIKGHHNNSEKRKMLQHIRKIPCTKSNNNRLYVNDTYIYIYEPIFEILHQRNSTHTPISYIKQNQFHNALVTSALHIRYATGIPKIKYTINSINNT
jgi:hypothetical protein